jgi:myo-inositol-1-phosphate synthase
MKSPSIRPAKGKLGVLLPGLGAVATTVIAGVMLARRGLAEPIGSLTQMGSVRRSYGDSVPIREYVPLASLEELVFGSWDVFPDSAYESALHAKVLEPRHLDLVREELSAIRPMPAAFYPEYVKRIHGPHVKQASTKADMVEKLREDIRRFKADNGCDRVVAVWCASTEVFLTPTAVHRSVRSFEAGLRANAPEISSSQLYAWACIKEGVPFANGAPNLCVDFAAAIELAKEHRVPLAGKDFKTGQTLMKTVVAPALKARRLGLRGWYSTNILGNRDGEVLDEPENFKSKEATKLGVLESILEPDRAPILYGDIVHKVRIDYYPPRGDAKEGWDNIDFFGWLGYPMQIKIDFQCRDSILAAPVVLDLALLMDLAQRTGQRGVQEWLSFYFKSPMPANGRPAEHDLFAQLLKLKNQLRAIKGESPIGKLGEEFYD